MNQWKQLAHQNPSKLLPLTKLKQSSMHPTNRTHASTTKIKIMHKQHNDRFLVL
jgi:hypothetical protein